MILRRHLLRIVAFRVLAALVVLVSILQVLDLLDATTDILQRKLGVGGVLYYATLRLPTLIQQVAPLSVLAGCMFAFIQLARENAVTALRSTGVSVYQLISVMVPAVLIVVVLHFVSIQWLTPRADQALDAWWSSSAPAADKAPKSNEARSFRVGNDIVTAVMPDASGRRLSQVHIYRRNADGALIERLRATEAVRKAGDWRLENATFDNLGASGVTHGQANEILWRSGPQPQDVRAIFAGDASLAPGSARRALAGGASTRPPSFYSTALQRGWAAPLSGLVMLLLAGPILLVNFRSGGANTVVLCLGAGLVFLVVDGVFSAMAESGAIPSVLGAWGALAIFGALGGRVLLQQEG
jgi:lipopolysaccharide export system permease protein